MTSLAPVFDMQIRNQIEIGAIAGDQRRTMCNGDGGNAQVVRSDPDFLDSPRLKELLGGVCIRKNREFADKRNRLLQQLISLIDRRSPLSRFGTADDTQPAPEDFFDDNDRKRLLLN